MNPDRLIDLVLEVNRLRSLIWDVATCGVDDVDPRLKYVNAQIDRDTWDAVQEEYKRIRPLENTDE